MTASRPLSGDRHPQRGFCPHCGSFLFWKGRGDSTVDVALGALDEPAGLTLARYILVAENGDYHDITDDLPQHPGEDT